MRAGRELADIILRAQNPLAACPLIFLASVCSSPPAKVQPSSTFDPWRHLCPSGSRTAPSSSSQGAVMESQADADLSAKAEVQQGCQQARPGAQSSQMCSPPAVTPRHTWPRQASATDKSNGSLTIQIIPHVSILLHTFPQEHWDWNPSSLVPEAPL